MRSSRSWTVESVGTSVLRLRVAHGSDQREVLRLTLTLLQFLRARRLRGVNRLHHVRALDGGEEPGAFLLVHHLEMAEQLREALALQQERGEQADDDGQLEA